MIGPPAQRRLVELKSGPRATQASSHEKNRPTGTDTARWSSRQAQGSHASSSHEERSFVRPPPPSAAQQSTVGQRTSGTSPVRRVSPIPRVTDRVTDDPPAKSDCSDSLPVVMVSSVATQTSTPDGYVRLEVCKLCHSLTCLGVVRNF